jgi:hypothetical protein
VVVGPERFELCRLDVVRVHDPTIISRVLLGVASCNITVLSYGPTGFETGTRKCIKTYQEARLLKTQDSSVNTSGLLRSLKIAGLPRRALEWAGSSAWYTRACQGSGLKNVRFARAHSGLVRPKGRGFKSRPVHHTIPTSSIETDL